MDTIECPECGHAMTRVVSRGIHHECRSCGGQLLGLVPFQVLVEPADGARIWRECEDGPVAGRCPFCGGGLHTPAGESRTGGLAVCRSCEQVWIPESAKTWMKAHAATATETDGQAVGAAHPEECDNCGAPYSPDASGRCRYCRTQLTANAPIIVAFPREPSTSNTSLLGVVADALFGMLADDI